MDDGSKALSKNGRKEEAAAKGELEPVGLAPEEQKSYRTQAARAKGNPRLPFPAKEVCVRVANPTVQDFQKLKKLGRFPVGLRDVQFCYKWQPESKASELRVFVDSDWAGCPS